MPHIGNAIWIGRNSGGTNWTTYWASLISATVAQATPTNVVLTFATPQTSLGASDLTVTVNGAARAVSSASWTGAVWTVVLASAVMYGDLVVITFVKSGGKVFIENNITHPLIMEDDNTIVSYDYSKLDTITKDVNDLSEKWEDELGSGDDLLQIEPAIKPKWEVDGMLFLTKWMKTAAIAAIAQPTQIYMIVKQVTWTNGDLFFDGDANSTMAIYQATSTPIINAYAGNPIGTNGNLAVDTWGIVRVLFDGINGRLQVDDTAAVTGNIGDLDGGGFTLGARGDGTATYAQIKVKNVLIRKVDGGTGNDPIYNYLKKKKNIMRDFSGLTRYVGNPIISHNTATWNAFGCASPLLRAEQKIGNTWYAIVQSARANNSWMDFGLYTSTDLKNWSSYVGNPILSRTVSAWDNSYLVHPCVIKIGTLWHLYYSGYSSAGVFSIGLATSPDFINWTKYASNPVWTGTAANAQCPSVIQIGSTYYMYYWNGLTDAGQGICYATSPDGITWTYGGICIGPDVNAWVTGYFLLDPWVTKRKSDGVYEMIFTRSTEQQLGYAVSYDGINWQVYDSAILVKDAGWENGCVGDGALVETPDGSCYLYYSGIESTFTVADAGLVVV